MLNIIKRKCLRPLRISDYQKYVSYIHDIPEKEFFVKAQIVDKGYSADAKYRILTKSGQFLMLKISDIEKYSDFKQQFEYLLLLKKNGIKTSYPVSFGQCNNRKNVYLLCNWIEGIPLDELLPKLSIRQQYNIGRKAGLLMKTIHTTNILPNHSYPALSFLEIHQLRIQKYMGYINRKGDSQELRLLYEYVKSHINCIQELPSCFLHGDFHIGNLILTEQKDLDAIDWIPFFIGKPWEDFIRIIVSGEASALFAAGQIDAYFSDNIPVDFWMTLAVYTASYQFEIIDWEKPVIYKDICFAEHQRNLVIRQYQNMTTKIPLYYKKAKSLLWGGNYNEH